MASYFKQTKIFLNKFKLLSNKASDRLKLLSELQSRVNEAAVMKAAKAAMMKAAAIKAALMCSRSISGTFF